MATEKTTISRARLIVMLARISRPTICTLYASTVPPMVKYLRGSRDKAGRRKPNPYYGRLRKQAKVNGIICFDYTRSVNAQRIRESDAESDPELFEPLARCWGGKVRPRMPGETPKPVPQSPFVEYRGWLYLEIKVERRLDIRYVLDGTPVTDKATIADIERQFVKRGEEGRRQKVQRAVVLRDYGIENVLGIQFGGQLWAVERG